MDWFKPLSLILMFSAAIAGAESRPASKPIEVTLPTSQNPQAVLKTDPEGKLILNKDFPPLATAKVKAAAQKALAPAKKAAAAAAPKAAAPTPAPTPTQAPPVPVAEDPSAELEPPTTTTTTMEPTTPAATNAMDAILNATPPSTREVASETKPTLPPAAEAAVILSRNQFYPSKLHVPEGTRVRIWFTTVESKPAALVIEGLKTQRWIASDNPTMTSGNTQGYFELQRELTRERVTEVTLQPSAGSYPFFDALSGARGEIIVE